MQPIRSLTVSTSVCALLLLACGTSVFAQQAPSNSASSMSTPADNSALNKRDRSSQTVTPTDQPNNKADIKLAAAVRRAIVNDDALSMSAHNVKLVVARGVVTLRGPVKNAQEQAKVEADAKGVAGVTTVDNQLDVKN